MKLTLLTLAAITAATLLAGCTVNTPPIEVRGPDEIGINTAGRTATIDATECNGAPEAEYAVNVPQNVNNIRVDVEAESRSSAPAVLLVIVKDRDTGDQLAKKRVVVENQTQTSLNVDVKGNNNVVVVTQAIEGSAVVNVAAHGSEANQAVGDDSTIAIGDDNQIDQDTNTSVNYDDRDVQQDTQDQQVDDSGNTNEDGGGYRYREQYRDDDERYRIDIRER
ncbi:MAG TPA: hypothetical protein VNZ52_05740 [Candidatus Thermoplasmatota archaeon]|nr:hypothetical protein [Candidatus Thermoplasmatota archaeon]